MNKQTQTSSSHKTNQLSSIHERTKHRYHPRTKQSAFQYSWTNKHRHHPHTKQISFPVFMNKQTQTPFSHKTNQLSSIHEQTNTDIILTQNNQLSSIHEHKYRQNLYTKQICFPVNEKYIHKQRPSSHTHTNIIQTFHSITQGRQAIGIHLNLYQPINQISKQVLFYYSASPLTGSRSCDLSTFNTLQHTNLSG